MTGQARYVQRSRRGRPRGPGRQAQRALPTGIPGRSPFLQELAMLKAVGWIIAIIFIIGLLVVFGVIDLIF